MRSVLKSILIICSCGFCCDAFFSHFNVQKKYGNCVIPPAPGELTILRFQSSKAPNDVSRNNDDGTFGNQQNPNQRQRQRQRKRQRQRQQQPFSRTDLANRRKHAEQVEARVSSALDILRDSLLKQNLVAKRNTMYASTNDALNLDTQTVPPAMETALRPAIIHFPSVRDCNAALATFGDENELLRALRLFFKMRVATSLSDKYRQRFNQTWTVPTPTLVTYSTIMSRAVYVGKPQVALRIWSLMRSNPDFFSFTYRNATEAITKGKKNEMIIPDIKAANILMNCFAKLADVTSAQDLLYQMKYGNGTDVPYLIPNIVTYNTLIHACHKANDLDSALQVKDLLDQEHQNGISPDIRTYTSLIATVARKPSIHSGINDPTMAFTLFNEMTSKRIQPNGMTYSALIDVCGRCKRVDLALQGLRMMQRQKVEEQQQLHHQQKEKYVLLNEVGAWTAAINACGKAGRVDSAVQLFYAMPNFGVQPNTITCGCLTDCLLKHGRIYETLDILAFMKKMKIVPSEYMYTSLMTSAGRLVQIEQSGQLQRKHQLQKMQEQQQQKKERNIRVPQTFFPATSKDGVARANSTEKEVLSSSPGVEVYTALMKSLIMMDSKTPKRESTSRLASSPIAAKTPAAFGYHTKNRKVGGREKEEFNNTLLLKVFLVFQEMKAAGAQPDLACFNALLNACARAGDINRSLHVLKQIGNNGLIPNDITWREIIKAAWNSKSANLAFCTWNEAINYHQRIHTTDRNTNGDRNLDASAGPNSRNSRGTTKSQNASTPVEISGGQGFETSEHLQQQEKHRWIPSAQSLAAMMSGILHYASDLNANCNNSNAIAVIQEKKDLYRKLIAAYERVLMLLDDNNINNRERVCDEGQHQPMLLQQPTSFLQGMEIINGNDFLENQRLMLIILQAVVSLEDLISFSDNGIVIPNDFAGKGKNAIANSKLQSEALKESLTLRKIAVDILRRPRFNENLPNQRISRGASWALEKTRSWMLTV